MSGSDSLTLKAVLGGQAASAALHNGQQTVTLTLNNVPAEQYGKDVMLSISGYQTASDVFLFDSRGGRGSSQAMVGMDDSQLPVYASVRATQDRVLKILKTTRSSPRRPLEGIVFDVFKIATMDEYMSGAVELPEPENCPHPSLAEYSLITDENGQATLNLTHAGLPDGVYLLVERAHPSIVAPLAPFYVSIPYPNASGTGYDYEVIVKPKNDVRGGVEIEKDVTSLGNDLSSVSVGENHTWIISSTIPNDIADLKSYIITDTLDNRLDYADGNTVVTVESADGQTVLTTLDADIDYKLTVTDVDSLSDGKPSDSFKLELTGVGMDKISGSIGNSSFSNYRIRVRYDAQINANAKIAEKIPNEASVQYTNSVNFTFSDVSDRPEVYTGAVNLLKVSADNREQVLPGAEFEVYRTATADEVAAGKDTLPTLEGLPGYVVKVSFYDNPALAGERVTSVTSDENGKVAIYGLALGEYYLVETKSPNGYNLMQSFLKLTVDDTSHIEENAVIIENVAGAVLPATGGIGTTVYTVSGTVLMGISILLLLAKKRRYPDISN